MAGTRKHLRTLRLASHIKIAMPACMETIWRRLRLGWMAVEMCTLPCWVISWNAVQSNLLPNFTIYKDSKEASAYTVPQGSEIDVYCKVIPCCP